jgi:predicted glycosyltransferase
VLTRRSQQRRAIAGYGLDVTLPERAVDARSLMYAADLVIGAGGTMTREAALLGVPTVSLFAGRSPAVDRWLEERGAMRHITSLDQLPPVRHRKQQPRDPAELRARGERLVAEFVEATMETGGATDRGLAPAEAHG